VSECTLEGFCSAEMLNTMNWQTLQERRLRTRLIMFHRVINENIAIPTQNILLQSQSTTRSSRKDSYRQIQCNKDSYKYTWLPVAVPFLAS
jgi:hypothetical protein